MVEKQVDFRHEYKYNSTQHIASNYYPITSAIAIRDHSKPDANTQKQITIVTDQAHGASSGLRGGKNIEIMQMRRLKRFDTHGVQEPLNEMGEDGRGVKNRANYYMQLTNYAASWEDEPRKEDRSRQREKQLRIDQPIVMYYA